MSRARELGRRWPMTGLLDVHAPMGSKGNIMSATQMAPANPKFDVTCMPVPELGRRLGISLDRTKRIIARGEIPALRIRRVGGSIPLGVLGGDRVVLSEDLRDALIRGGRIEPYRRTYAKPAPGAPALLAGLEIVYRGDLFGGLPALAAPSKAKPAPRRRLKVEPPSLPLTYGPTIGDLLEGLGETHAEAAALVGISRPQATNIIVGRFGASRQVAQRVLELAQAVMDAAILDVTSAFRRPTSRLGLRRHRPQVEAGVARPAFPRFSGRNAVPCLRSREVR